MCGIIAVTKEVPKEKMTRVLDKLYHRGPDEGGQLVRGNFHIGHRRLSIVGLNDGIQPISNEAKNVHIVCNGEIYNYLTLKKDLQTTETFHTHSDSEAVLKVYEKEGPQGVEKLDGMFAFFLADETNNTFMAARDTLGIKPLYYGKMTDGSMVFSSELKGIYEFTNDAKEFPQGHYYTPETGFKAYRTIEAGQEPVPAENFKEHEVLEGIRNKLTDAVRKRFMADVEVGVLLSGGLDSSLISAIGQRIKRQDQPLHSFCVGNEGSPDLQAAREVADYIGTIHHEYVYTKDELVEALPKVIYYLESYDPSLVRSAIPTYFVSKLASDYVKVILSGEGADELFSGYAYLQEIQNPVELNKELYRIVNSLHNINLQRLDRMSMAHSLEGRVPFLDLELIDYVLSLPAEWKLSSDESMEKTLLRKAFNGYLPDSLLWRKKAEFSEGSGALDVLETYANEQVSDQELQESGLRSKQEHLYYHIFKEHYPHKSALDTVGQWAVI
ncbi:asparagine synthase B [Salipaludibacillus aurantiacus]|uniref:asparagine synthase (glutamine-hydrolyzing) n=1 Tax=Salipaludibacillus aurantiacus TaxID=1601833 RepID=A0A1H9SD90_9BACI|nr:asparagine synthase B [Salipaludibacillus aurantiacus]SER82947.1 asparagine synthase (glutamine-hydrolysing) [Salipaludibacillus aurantiacus]